MAAVYRPGLMPTNSTFRFGAIRSGTVLCRASSSSCLVGRVTSGMRAHTTAQSHGSRRPAKSIVVSRPAARSERSPRPASRDAALLAGNDLLGPVLRHHYALEPAAAKLVLASASNLAGRDCDRDLLVH